MKLEGSMGGERMQKQEAKDCGGTRISPNSHSRNQSHGTGKETRKEQTAFDNSGRRDDSSNRARPHSHRESGEKISASLPVYVKCTVVERRTNFNFLLNIY